MFTPPDPPPGSFRFRYRIRNGEKGNPECEVEVYATREEITAFTERGYLVRERLFTPEQVERLRAALDEVAARELGEIEISRSRRFGGLFLRHLMDKHPTFLELFRFPPTLSVARAMLGPQIQVRPLTARISYPDQPNQETHWHFHQRIIPSPLPPFLSRPHVMDCLIYLDELNDANGPLCVVPGSHHRLYEDLPPESWDDLSGQVTLRLPAGSCVMIHGCLWHRALPTTPQGTVRRLLILPYAASWLKLPSYGARPKDGLMAALYTDADAEMLELLGEPEGLY